MAEYGILSRIGSPEDLRRLDENELAALSAQIRQIIIETTSKNGGHLASNLGVVEATLAMHRVFSCPADAFIFDVGHQAYTHKLLTGRFDCFPTLRTAGGISGFTNREESRYDAVTAGHSGTSLSTAIGIAEANRLAGREDFTVALVGDGSFTNGMIYEALNQLAGKNLRIVIILNDNEMSISKNVGGVSSYLSLIRTSERYFSFKVWLNRIFGAIPVVGRFLVGAAAWMRDFVKRTLNSESFFENLGLEYIGPVNGNDIKRLEAVLEEAKKKKCPVVVHMKTKKGFGFAPSEERPDKYHSTGAFELHDNESEDTFSQKRRAFELDNAVAEDDPSKNPGALGLADTESKPKPRTFTEELSELLCNAAEADPAICAMTAAMTDGCGLTSFAGRYPERFFDVGIAEEHLVTMAGGLALGGMHPAAVLYSTFAQRTFDQLWHDVCLQNARVMLFLSHCGLVPGDGVTHQGIYDVSMLCSLPRTEVYSADDNQSMRLSFEMARQGEVLSVVRYPKGKEAVYGDVQFTESSSRLWKYAEIGTGDGYDAIVTYGRIAENAAMAAKIHAHSRGRAVRLLVLRRIHPTPVDSELTALISGAREVYFVEEVYREAGISDRFAADIGRCVRTVAIEEGFVPHGELSELMTLTRMDADGIFSRM